MGAPESGMQAAEQPSAEELLGSFKRIDAAERRKHEAVLNYWLSIRGDKEFPPLHDLDPLELSDAAPASLLLELISGGHDAEIRHRGEALKSYIDVDRIIDAGHPSLLSSIAKKLPIVAISRDFLAFEDEYSTADGKTRCWVTLLPLSAGGAWVDYVYALVSIDGAPAESAAPAKKPTKSAGAPEPAAEIEGAPVAEEPVAEHAEEVATEADVEETAEPVEETVEAEEAAPQINEAEEVEATVEEPAAAAEADGPEAAAKEPELVTDEEPEAVLEGPQAGAEEHAEAVDEEAAEAAAPKSAPGFSKLLDSLAGLTGFYGSHGIKAEPVMPGPAPSAEEPEAVDEPSVAEEPVEEAQEAAEVVETPAVAEESVDEPVTEEAVATPPANSVAELLDLAERVAAEAPPTKPQPASAPEGTLQSKLTQVRAKADEARAARQRATAALYEGLSAAYDFAVDAEDAPEEYLKLVEAQGLKIQLRSPMKPVVKLAFDGTVDEPTIKQLEAVLAWALKEELPRGTLLERLEAEGGIAGVLKAA
jgi:hypothetical protein